MTADILLNALGIHATVTNLPQAQGVLALEDGKMDAIIHVGGAPIPLLTQIEPGHGLHVIPIQITPELAETYLPDQLTHAEYPDLIPANSPPVPTLAVGDVLAAYDWPPTTQRYKNVAAFVDALFARFSELQKPPHHPKWREVNLAADCPGWPRFPEAQRLIDNMVAEQNLSRFAAEHGVPPLTDQQQQALFRDFVRWEHEQAASNTIDVHTR